MCLLFLVGATGLSLRHFEVEVVGRLGLAGFLLLGLTWARRSGFVHIELFLLPVLATEATRFVA
jgi:hypothetical protein